MAIQHTQGKWRVNQDFIIGDRYVAKIFDHSTALSQYKNINSSLKAESKANAALICDAVNNTAGAGIDPNAVPGLLEALKDLIHGHNAGMGKKAIQLRIELAEDAIKAAELKQ